MKGRVSDTRPFALLQPGAWAALVAPLMTGVILALFRRVDGELDINPPGFFKDQRAGNQLALFQLLLQTHEHDVIAAALKGQGFTGELKPRVIN